MLEEEKKSIKEQKTKEIQIGAEEYFKCKICGEVKKRILAGMYDHKNKRWVDEQGRDHSGKTCSSCQGSRCKHSMKRLRQIRKAEASREDNQG